MLNEFKAIRNALLRLFGALLLLVVVGLTVPIPYIGVTATEWAIGRVQADLVPAGATVAVLTPLDGFFAQAAIAAALAAAAVLPLFFFEIWRFMAPALLPPERRALLFGLLGALLLAAFGAVFAYSVLVPIMFTELFAFVPAGAMPLFNLRAVLSQVSGFVLGTALIFLLPLAMVVLSRVGLVPAGVWRAWGRVAVLLVLVLSAIITPDGSGAGMVLLALPVCALYGVGYAGARLLSKNKN